MLQQELETLTNKLLEEANLVKEMLEKGVMLITTKDDSIYESMKELEQRVNEMEVEIENRVIELLARFQPEAKDLRTLIAIVKINNDLERIADHSVNISQDASYLLGYKDIPEEICEMAQKCKEMLSRSIEAFKNLNDKEALKICSDDRIIDDYKKSITLKLLSEIRKSPQDTSVLYSLLLIAKNLERIGDLSTNICEDVIYMIKGKSIKHMHLT